MDSGCTASPSAQPDDTPQQQQESQHQRDRKTPLVILVVGMAGTGKTTLVHRLQHYTSTSGISSYFINLDPAVTDTPYDVNIDIRDTVNYKDVIQQYRLGPNGGIMTTLNLYATKFHQVISILEKKAASGLLDWIIVDTPGQIEVFTWSASGQLITEALASTFPTVVLFVADTTRCVSPQTFMSTMLYSSSIMFKTQLPLLLALNKSDAVDHNMMVEWMRDPDALQDAVRGNKNYSATLTQSLALFVHEYYETMQAVGVSAVTGLGMDELRAALEAAKETYASEFLPLVKRRAEEQAKKEKQRVEKQMSALRLDSQSK
mmetsp:Transcript_68368/g.79607  ORF Transcript_68368/g.79607 Transcript_68368/m.79607 type:complete len:318 (-) Transcript_68368:66-1019(-)